MALGEDKVFKYPAEDECLVRRLGSGVMAAWPHLPPEARAMAERFIKQGIVKDRAAYVAKFGADYFKGLTPTSAPSGSVDYGDYR